MPEAHNIHLGGSSPRDREGTIERDIDIETDKQTEWRESWMTTGGCIGGKHWLSMDPGFSTITLKRLNLLDCVEGWAH